MKKYLLFCLVLVVTFACKKEENIDVKRVMFSFEIVNSDNQYIFTNNKYNPDSAVIIEPVNSTVFLTDKLSFRNVAGRIISKKYEQVGVQSIQGVDYKYTSYIYLSKQDTDTLQIIKAPYSVRDIGSGDGDYPTYMAFYYNGKMAAEFDFVKNPELLQPFWQTDGIGQIITLQKK